MANALHNDILEQILIKLDVKDLIRYKSVCKSWHSFISSTRFTKSHLNNTLYNNDLYNKKMGYRFGYRRIIMCTNLGYVSRGSVKKSDYDFDTCHLIGSCNGLVCIAHFNGEILVANPVTREVKKLRKLKVHDVELVCRGFGYDSLVDDYKVVLGLSNGYNVTRFCVLNLKKNVWKNVGELKYRFIIKVGILCNGGLHWIMNDLNKIVILSFDLSKEEFKEIPKPEDSLGVRIDPRNDDVRLGIIEDCLCITNWQRTWIMKNYNVKQSWKIAPDILRLYEDRLHCLKRLNDYVPYTTNFFYGRWCCRDTEYVGAPIFVESLVSPNVKGKTKRKRKEGNSNSNNKLSRDKFRPAAGPRARV